MVPAVAGAQGNGIVSPDHVNPPGLGPLGQIKLAAELPGVDKELGHVAEVQHGEMTDLDRGKAGVSGQMALDLGAVKPHLSGVRRIDVTPAPTGHEIGGAVVGPGRAVGRALLAQVGIKGGGSEDLGIAAGPLEGRVEKRRPLKPPAGLLAAAHHQCGGDQDESRSDLPGKTDLFHGLPPKP
jgi:hypothetical protein